MTTPARPYIDLHLHSHYSDGSDSPTEIVERAAKLGITAISLTDHDTTAGLGECAAACEAAGIGFVTGVELSCRFTDMGLHVLAYGFDPAHAALSEAIASLAQARARRISGILEKLHALGIILPPLQQEGMEGQGALTRMHVARALLETGHARTVQRAFDQFLNPGCIAWEPQESAPVEDIIPLIHDAGGLAVVAHPCLTRRIARKLDDLLQLPFDGIEVYHSSHKREDTQRLKLIAHERRLLTLGGSDCHGTIKGKREMGGVKTPLVVWEALRRRLAKH